MINFSYKKIKGFLAFFLAGILFTGLVPAAQANKLETFLLDVSRNRVEFSTQGQLEPQGQIITNPTRLVIDLPGARFSGPTLRRKIGSMVESLRIGQLDALTTRMVIEFSPEFDSNLLEEKPLKLEAKSSSRWSIQFPVSATGNFQNNSALIAPTSGEITSPFGWRIHPISRKRQLHKGIDYAAFLGVPILAAADGIVNDVGWDDGGYGNFVELRHPDGSLTLYGHANRILVAKGRQVNQGQIIAEVGSTGYSTGPHLHFEVQVNGQAVDPAPLLRNDLVILNLANR